MANVFVEDTMRQHFVAGVQDEQRALIPMADVAETVTDDLSTYHSRYGDDFAADNSTTSTTGAVHDVTYADDTIAPTDEANKRTRIANLEIVRSAKGASGGWDLVFDHKDRHVRALAVAVHRKAYRATVDGAGHTIDAGVVAGAASNGTPITLSASNPNDIAVKVFEKMVDAGVTQQGTPYFMLDGSGAGYFKLLSMASGFGTADRQLGEGWKITTSWGFDYFQSPEVERSQVLTFTGRLVADNTVTFTAGTRTITLTAKASPTTAGHVDVGTSTDEDIANIAAAINGSAGAGTAYIELSAADRNAIKLAGIVATVDTDAGTVTLSSFRKITGAGTLTNATWGTEVKHYLAGLRGSTKLLLPRSGYNLVEDMSPDNSDGTKFLGMELISSQIHNSGVLTKDADKIAVVNVVG
jgi:hypothetical protein